jgi:hypothetical protein
MGDEPDGGGTDSAAASGAASGEGEASEMEVMGAVATETAFTLVEEAGEVGKTSFLENDFFSLARLNFSGRHLELLRELFAPRRIRLLVDHKDALVYLELCRGGALAEHPYASSTQWRLSPFLFSLLLSTRICLTNSLA